jgi:hypothetical protein
VSDVMEFILCRTLSIDLKILAVKRCVDRSLDLGIDRSIWGSIARFGDRSPDLGIDCRSPN